MEGRCISRACMVLAAMRSIVRRAREGVDGAVVYVQDGSREKPGAMLGAAYTSLH